MTPRPSAPQVRPRATRRPETQPAARPKPAKKRKKVKKTPAAAAASEAAGVAGSIATLPHRLPDPPEPTNLPSGVAAAAPTAGGGMALTSLVLSVVIMLGVMLFALAALPTRQLAVLPGARWIAMKRLDLVIAGTAAIIGVLGALLIAEFMP